MDFLNSIHELEEDDQIDKREPEELFQDSWFFGNLLQTSCNRPKMLRSFSDPCTSSSSSSSSSHSMNQDQILTGTMSYEETYRSIKKLNENPSKPNNSNNNLMKAPSMPASSTNSRDRKLSKGSDLRRNKSLSKKKVSSNNLFRAPSLPTSFESQEFDQEDDEEIEFSMGKLIRQASMKCSDTLPHKTQAAKVSTPSSSSISRQRSIKKTELEIIKMEGSSEDMIPQVPMKQLQPQKSLTKSLKSEELQGFKDLGFEFNKMDLNPATTSISLNSRDTKKSEEKNIRQRSYYTEAWRGHSSAPPVPKWGVKKSNNDVMKEQIKFWARAVASNVRQEC